MTPPSFPSFSGTWALAEAVHNGQFEVAKALLANAAALDKMGPGGPAAPDVAPEEQELLLATGAAGSSGPGGEAEADCSEKQEETSALHRAAAVGNARKLEAELCL